MGADRSDPPEEGYLVWHTSNADNPKETWWRVETVDDERHETKKEAVAECWVHRDMVAAEVLREAANAMPVGTDASIDTMVELRCRDWLLARADELTPQQADDP